MSRGIAQMRNLGPAMARALAEIGVSNEDQLRELGPVEAYARILFFVGKRGMSLNALYSMDAALKEQSWTEVTAARKAELRAALAART